MVSDLSARFRAVEILQRFRDRHPPGSARFDELDHAIDLALQQRRVVNEFLLRNVIRDAERVVRRRRRRQRLVIESNHSVAGTDAHANPLCDQLEDPATPEAEVAMAQVAERVLDPRGARRGDCVLECIINGLTTRETARVAGISSAHAAKLSRRLKSAVQAAIGSDVG